MLDEDQPTEVTTNRNEERPALTRLVGHVRFIDQAIDADGDLIEKVMMMAEAEPINLDQAMNDSNWLASMKEEIRTIEKNKTWEIFE